MEQGKGQILNDFEDSQVPFEKENSDSTAIVETTSDNRSLTGDEEYPSIVLTEGSTTAIPGQNSAPSGRTTKSFFEITRVETSHGHGENAGEADNENEGDSEMDDTLDHDSSITIADYDSITHNKAIAPVKSCEETVNEKSLVDAVDNSSHTKPLAVDIHPSIVSEVTNSSTTSTPPLNITPATTAEPTSRFRIVKKSTRNKPYERGKWTVNDYQDHDRERDSSNVDHLPKQSESVDIPQSVPSSLRRSGASQSKSFADQKLGGNGKGAASPAEAVNPKPSEVPEKNTSRGTSLNITAGTERRSLLDSASFMKDSSVLLSSPQLQGISEEFDKAMGSIHTIRESLMSTFKEEMKKLTSSMYSLQKDNEKLKAQSSIDSDVMKKLREDNEILRKKIRVMENEQQIELQQQIEQQQQQQLMQFQLQQKQHQQQHQQQQQQQLQQQQHQLQQQLQQQQQKQQQHQQQR